MLSLRYTTAFKQDYKRLQKRGYDMAKLRQVLEHLAGGEPHLEQYQDHPLRGNYAGTRDRHVEPDWVLVYVIVGEELRLLRTGTHADLFKK
jgi:mRNA interferase YafQ